MAVGGPLVISGNVAALKWRPFSSCFNLGILLPRCISLLFISCLPEYNTSVFASLCAHILYILIWTCRLIRHVSVKTRRAAFLEMRALKQKTLEMGTSGGDDMHCLLNRMLWDDSVIMLSSCCFYKAKLGLYSVPSPHSRILTSRFNGQKQQIPFGFGLFVFKPPFQLVENTSFYLFVQSY